MDRRVFIVHPSEIIQLGLNTLVQDQFDLEPILVKSIEELKNYFSIQKSQIVFLADSQFGQESFSAAIGSFDSSNSIKTIFIREKDDKSACKHDCECCFSIMDEKSRMNRLINTYLQVNGKSSSQKSNTRLTEREVDVLKLVAIGKTNKEIADELNISFHTVISHRKNITDKLGIKSISGLTVYAILNNLVDTSSIDLE